MTSCEFILSITILLLINTLIADSKSDDLPIFQVITQKQLSTLNTPSTKVNIVTTSNYPTKKKKKNKLTIFQTQPEKQLPIVTTTITSTFCPYGTGINGSSCIC